MPIIQIVAFRGTGGVIDKTKPWYGKEMGLVRAGHVGLQSVFVGKIIGFSPTPEAVQALGSEQALLDKLVNEYEAQPGCLQDDTDIFIRADELADATKGRTTVWQLDIEISDEILATIREWYNRGWTALYNLPYPQPPEFKPGVYNCAVFPQHLGVSIPAETGKLRQYILAMQIQGATRWTKHNLNR